MYMGALGYADGQDFCNQNRIARSMCRARAALTHSCTRRKFKGARLEQSCLHDRVLRSKQRESTQNAVSRPEPAISRAFCGTGNMKRIISSGARQYSDFNAFTYPIVTYLIWQ
jgi:hypothetical protein